MTASEKTLIGIAEQTAFGTPNTTDNSFDYLLFTQGGLSVAPVNVPLDMEVGGGAVLRDVIKGGVVTGGQLQVIPRPNTLGWVIKGMTGNVVSVDGLDGSYTHTFTLGADPFAAPYFTARIAPGNMWGEQYQDMRFTSLALQWRGGRFLTGAYGLIGGLPAKVASMSSWNAAAKIDGGPQFLAPLGDIELPSGTKLNILSGSFAAQASIPLDEQWIVGQYTPQNFDITQRAYMLQMAVKIVDDSLQKKIMYDPAGGSAWLATMLKDGTVKVKFSAAANAGTTPTPYSLEIDANGVAQGSLANVAWSASPINFQAGRVVVMNIVGTFLADPAGASPITIKLVNTRQSYA